MCLLLMRRSVLRLWDFRCVFGFCLEYRWMDVVG